MKKIIKQAVLLSLFLNFASCIPDDSELDYTASSGNTVLTTTSISRLDKTYDLPINIIAKSGATASKIEVFYNTSTVAGVTYGDKIGDAIISVDGSKATINTSLLRDFEHFGTNKNLVTGTFPLILKSTFSDGTVLTNPYSLAIGKGISFYEIVDGIDTNTSAPYVKEINYLNNTEGVQLIRYKVAKKATTVVNKVEMQWKKGKTGTYATSPLIFPTTKDYFDLGTVDYTAWGLTVGDVLYIKFIVTAGGQSDSIETSVTVVTQGFPNPTAASLTDDLAANKFNLEKGSSYANTDTEHGEIAFSSPFGITKTGATEIDFVKVANPSATYFKDANLFSAETDYLAGTKVTSVTNLAKGDVVIYKIVRDQVDYYGLINIVSTSTVNSTNSFEFEFKEGAIIR